MYQSFIEDLLYGIDSHSNDEATDMSQEMFFLCQAVTLSSFRSEVPSESSLPEVDKLDLFEHTLYLDSRNDAGPEYSTGIINSSKMRCVYCVL